MKTVKLLIFAAFMACNLTTTFSQTHVNREWMTEFGYPDTLAWSKAMPYSLNSDYEIHVGNTVNSQQGVEVLITFIHVNGTIVWQETYTTGATHNCYGVDVKEDGGLIYVVGTTDNGGGYHDILLLKYDKNGDFFWAETYNSPYELDDVATAIDLDGGDLYIAGSSHGGTTDFDYLVLKYDTAGVFDWDARYDGHDLIDVPVDINFVPGRVIVTGASASSNTNWDYTTAYFNPADGSIMADIRDSVQGVGYDMPYGMTTDDDGNIFVTGRTSSNGIDYDIRTVKMDSALNILWSETFDFQGLYDVGQTIELDDFGNIFIGGYVTRANNVEEMVLIKYDENGNELWNHVQAGEDFTQPAHVMDVSTSSNGDLYFLGQEMANSGYNRLVVGKIDSTGATKWQRRTKQANHEFPLSIQWYDDTLIYVNSAIQVGQEYIYKTRRYSQFSQDPSIEYVQDTIPAYRSKELIVRFKQNSINTDAIDNLLGKRTEFAPLEYYLTSEAMMRVDEAVKNTCTNLTEEDNVCGITAVKIFKQLTSDYKTTTSRMGETIKVPDFWTTLLLSFPESVDLEQAFNGLSNLDGYVAYVEGNYFIQPTTIIGVNDYHFVNFDQESIFTETFFSQDDDPNDTTRDCSIRIKDAWTIFPEAGRQDIRCGVTDRAIAWWHEDFGSNPSFGDASTKVRGGFDYFSGTPLFDYVNLTEDQVWHGTECAGIIGAIRNNEIGVAGIAGGDYQGFDDPDAANYFDDKGVSLYSLIIYDLELSSSDPIPNPLQSVYDAFVMSAMEDDSLKSTLGLHVNNNSWISFFSPLSTNNPNAIYNDTNLFLMTEATRFANKAKVSVVASRGNAFHNQPGSPSYTYFTYPACIDDDWVINVGGTGEKGVYPEFGEMVSGYPMISNGIDVSAPVIKDIITTTRHKPSSPNSPFYGSFDKTSAAAPHVSGVVSLLLGYLNETFPDYKNLSPEDCEHILELSAENYNDMGNYNDSIGWGKMSASLAFHLIEKPYNTVHHFGSNPQFTHNTSSQLESSNATIYLKEPVQDTSNQWYSKGFHDVNVYRVETTVYHEIDPIDTIVAYWARPSSSTVMEPVINDSLLPRERVYIDYLDKDSAVLHGYVYEMLDEFGTPIGWLPRDTTLNDELWLEYTVISRDSTAPVVHTEKEELTNNIVLYPNPSTDLHTIKLEGFANQKVFITLYDIQGRSLGNVYEGKLEENTILEFDVSHLPFGLYLYDVRMETERRALRFIKQ